MTARPWSIRTGPQSDYDIFFDFHGMRVHALMLDISDTLANLKTTTFTDNSIVDGFYVSLQNAILGIEKCANHMRTTGVKTVLDTWATNVYSYLYYFDLYFEKAMNDIIDAQAHTDIQIDVNAVPTPDEPHIEEWCQRLGAICGLIQKTEPFPGVNRLWDTDGDDAQIGLLSMIWFLAIIGCYIGPVVQSAAFGIQYTKQFDHRLTDIDLSGDSPLDPILEYLDDPAGDTWDDTNFDDHVAVVSGGSLPNVVNTIKEMFMHNFKLSKMGLDIGRKFFGLMTSEKKISRYTNVNLLGYGSDQVDTDVLQFDAYVSAAIHLSLYTDAVKAVERLLDHQHASWNTIKSVFDKMFVDAGLGSFSGYGSVDVTVLDVLFMVSANTVSNGLYTAFERWDEAADVASVLNNAIITADAGESLFCDHWSYENVKDYAVLSALFVMEENDLTVRRRKAGGVVWLTASGHPGGWCWDADSSTYQYAILQGNWDHANIEGEIIIDVLAKPLTLSQVDSRVGYIFWAGEIPQTLEIEYINHASVLGRIYKEGFIMSKTGGTDVGTGKEDTERSTEEDAES
jgi:hypothetical protein